MEKSHIDTERNLNNPTRSHKETDYYPSDREILAAKASEIFAECVRISDLMPSNEYLRFYFINGDTVGVNHFIDGAYAANPSFTCYLDWVYASRRLDEMLDWVKRFALRIPS